MSKYSRFLRNTSKIQNVEDVPTCIPGGPIPQNMAKTFDGPPTIKRSGSEHQRAVTPSLFGQERGLVRDVEPSLMIKKDGMILEKD
jgi:hypothetical protein